VTSVQCGDSSKMEGEDFSCPHYRRKCKFVTPCCDGLYRCRFCHDEEQDHTLRRDDVTQVECSACGERQGVVESCRKCGLRFGKYFCFDCKLYDDEDKQQFHCTGCGICRVGGRSNYFHCHRCDMCLPNHLEGAHKCVEKVSRSNCPVCQEDIHTSRIPSQIPPCNHLIHKTCFDEMLSNGHYACPLCGVSMMDMTDVWKIYDKEISETPMPEEYLDLYAAIQCRDCFKPSLSRFHILGMKCIECGSFNTVRDKGPLVRQVNDETGASALQIEPDFIDVDAGLATADDSDDSESSVPALISLSPEPMQDDDYLPQVTVVGEPVLAGSLTPPETPTREEDISRVELVATSTSLADNSVSMTPEPSPLRELLPRREANISSIARRISFSDSNTGQDQAGK